MNKTTVAGADIQAELAQGLEKGLAFDIADCAPDFNDGDIHAILPRGQGMNTGFDFIGDMGNNLYCLAQIFAAALFLDDRVINGSCGGIAFLGQFGRGEAFVMTQVQVCFRSIVSNEHLTMLKGIHRAGVYVNIRVHLHHGDAQPARFKKQSQTGGSNAFAYRGHHTARCKHVLGHLACISRWFRGVDFLISVRGRNGLSSGRQSTLSW